MAIERLEKSEWRPFFNFMSKVMVGRQAQVDVVSLKHGDEVAAQWLPLLGMVYDPENDVVEILLDGRDHMVYQPQELYVDFGLGGLQSMEVVDSESVQQIVVLRAPLMLPGY
jgi:hypothetical protein